MLDNCLHCNCLLIKKNTKFCSSSCSAKYNNIRRKTKKYILSKEGLENIKNSNKNRKIKQKNKIIFCKCCQKSFIKEKSFFCSIDCKKEYLKKSITTETRLRLSRSLTNFYKTDNGLININKLKVLGEQKIFSDDSKKKMSDKAKEKCKDLNERIRLREIGRKGGFGKKGFTEMGTRYESSFEKKCFEFLENNKIIFLPHKNLPESSKVSDIFLPYINLWIELDGINREKKKKYLGSDYDYWLDKLKQYEQKKLDYKIFYTFEEFRKYIEKASLAQLVQ